MNEISFKRRWQLWLTAWIIALTAVGAPKPGLILYIWLFPFGLIEAVGWKRSGDDNDYLVGWLLYLALTVAALWTRRRAIYFTLYTILCIVLLLNVVGCHQMDLNFSDLH